MASSSGFADYVCEQLEGLGRVHAKPMFGGFGIYLGSRMFALIAGDELFLKADEGSRGALLALGGRPFKPFEDRPAVMPYVSVGADLLDDAEQLCDLARQSLAVARKAPAKSPSRRKA